MVQQVGGLSNSSTSVPMLPTTSPGSPFGSLTGLAARRPSMCPPTFIMGNRSADNSSSLLQQSQTRSAKIPNGAALARL